MDVHDARDDGARDPRGAKPREPLHAVAHVEEVGRDDEVHPGAERLLQVLQVLGRPTPSPE